MPFKSNTNYIPTRDDITKLQASDAAQLENARKSTSTFKFPWIALVSGLSFLFFCSSIFLVLVLSQEKTKNANSYQNGYSAGSIDTKESARIQSLEDSRNNTQQFVADNIYGNFTIDYPEDWSTSILKDSSSIYNVVAHPNKVDLNRNRWALNVLLIDTPYSLILEEFLTQDNDLIDNKRGTISKLNDPNGTEYYYREQYFVDSESDGIVSIIPVDDKTLYIYTFNSEFYGQNYEEIISSIIVP